MVRIFIGDKEVRREDLEKYEIKSEAVKRIISQNASDSRKAG